MSSMFSCHSDLITHSCAKGKFLKKDKRSYYYMLMLFVALPLASGHGGFNQSPKSGPIGILKEFYVMWESRIPLLHKSVLWMERVLCGAQNPTPQLCHQSNINILERSWCDTQQVFINLENSWLKHAKENILYIFITQFFFFLPTLLNKTDQFLAVMDFIPTPFTSLWQLVWAWTLLVFLSYWVIDNWLSSEEPFI